MFRILFVLIAFAWSSFQVKAQQIKSLLDNNLYRHTLNYPSHKITFYTQHVQEIKHAPEGNKFYYWYANNTISITQGGYSGRLLNGLYSDFFLDKNLKEEGTFDDGLKEGLWRSWFPGGLLESSLHYSKGILKGGFSRYASSGKLLQEGNYKNGKLHGSVINYDSSDSTQINKYKNGTLQQVRIKKNRILNLLRRKSNKST